MRNVLTFARERASLCKLSLDNSLREGLMREWRVRERKRFSLIHLKKI